MDDQKITGLVSGELKGIEREVALRHLINSPEAMQTYKKLTDLQIPVRPTGQTWTRERGLLGVAVTVLAVLTLTTIIAPLDDIPSDDAVRSPLHDRVSPADRSAVSGFPEQFRWSAEPGALRYRVRVYDVRPQIRWESDWTDGTEVAGPTDWPAAASQGVGRYFWIVEVDGRVPRKELGPFWFDVSAVDRQSRQNEALQ